jgi:hypothetical protein
MAQIGICVITDQTYQTYQTYPTQQTFRVQRSTLRAP